MARKKTSGLRKFLNAPPSKQSTSTRLDTRYLLPEQTWKDDLYKELGKVAANFSMVEMGTELLFLELSGLTPGIGEILVENMPLSTMLQKLERLAALCCASEKERKDVLEVAKSIREASTYRNELLHSFWTIKGIDIGVFRNRKTRGRQEIEIGLLQRYNSVLEKLSGRIVNVTEKTIRRKADGQTEL